MPISFVASGTVATGANPTVTVPSGYALNDLLVIITTGTATPTTPSGWTQLAAQAATGFVTILYKFAAATEASVALTLTGSTSKAVMTAYRGVSLTDTISAFTTGTGTTRATATLTTTYANEYVISVYGSNSGSATNWTAPASTTARVTSSSTSTIAGLLVVDELQATAGVSTARTATVSASRTLSAVAFSIVSNDRYWVGGAGTWDATAGTKWAITSGGTGGAPVPSAIDNVFLNAASGANTVTVSGSRTCLDLTCTGFTGTLTGTSTPVLTISGNMTLVSGMTFGGTFGINRPTLVFNSTTSKTIQSGTKELGALTFNGVGGSWSLQSDTATNGTTTLTNGTLNLNGFAHSPSKFSSDNSNTRTLAFGTGSVALSRSNGSGSETDWNCATITGLTITGTPNVTLSYNALPSSSYTITINHGSTAGGTAANAINLTAVNDWDDTTVIVNGAFNNINVSTAGATSEFGVSGCTVYGNLTLSALGPTRSSANVMTMGATSGTQDITSNGATVNFAITQAGAGGTVRLLDALVIANTRTLTLNEGTFNANNFNVTVPRFASTGTGVRTLTMGSGTWTISDASSVTVWDTSVITNLTLNKDTANIVLSASASTNSRTFSSGGLTFNKLTIGGSGTGTTYFAGTPTFSELASTKTTKHTISGSGSPTVTVTTWSIQGASASASVFIGSPSPADALNVTKSGGGTVTADYLIVNGGTFLPSGDWDGDGTSFVSGTTTGWVNVAGYFDVLTTASTSPYTIPTSWTPNNEIHLIAGGGGGAGSNYNATGTRRAAGGGGGGGGYTKITNFSATPGDTFTFTVGAGGAGTAGGTATLLTGTTGGSTTWNAGAFSASGGAGGTSNTTSSAVSTGGAGGVGSTYNGGNGAAGGVSTSDNNNGGGGGGGSGGPNGKGGNGGTGITTQAHGGGGGGGGGGTNGSAATTGDKGAGGNNWLGTGGATSDGADGTLGGGGAGGDGSTGGDGGPGIEFVNQGYGSGGGSGGNGDSDVAPLGGLYGGGGGGGGMNSTTVRLGGNGADGIIVLLWPVTTANSFLMLFM